MNILQIKESIEQILDLGGTVSFSYKEDLKDWVQTINISHFDGYYSEPTYVIHNGPEHGDYKDMDIALYKFIECIFNENNIWLSLERIKNRLNIQDWGNEGYDFENPSEVFLNLIEKEKQLIREELNPWHVYQRDECIFKYCDDPVACKKLNKCRHSYVPSTTITSG